MFFRFLRGLILITVLFGLFIPTAGAAQPLGAEPCQVEPLSVDVIQPNVIASDERDTFFDDSYVHEIYLTFDEADYGTTGWYDTLYKSHANDPDAPYFPADFSADGVTIIDVGVRRICFQSLFKRPIRAALQQQLNSDPRLIQ